GTQGGISATSPGTEAGSFVSPFFLIAQYAPFRGVGRPVTEQCTKVPLPKWGGHIYLPYFSSGASVTSHTENTEVSASSPAAALESAELQEASGQVIISQQLQERAAVVGGEFDIIISKQLREQWEERTEKITLNAIYATVKGVTGAAEYKTKK